MKSKHLLALLLAGTLSVGCLAGCGQEQQTAESSSQQESSVSSEASEQTQESSKTGEGPITTEPITISILTTRQSSATNEAEDLWYFKYLEWWMNEQGYNVTIEVQQTLEPDQQVSLLLGTDTLPDLVWGINLKNEQAVVYGAADGIVMDWAPYLNEETMPNLMALLENNPSALAGSTCFDGGVYGLPYLTDRGIGQGAGNNPGDAHVYINKNWLEKCGLDVPQNIDEFLDMLRAFKEVELESGEEPIPLINYSNLIQSYLWMCMGYYGNGYAAYGQNFLIKDGEVRLPAYTEDYRTFIEIMHTMYDEGLISKDFFTMDKDTGNGLMASGVAGTIGTYALVTTQPDTWSDWTTVEPFAIGDTETVAASVNATYNVGNVWASASTEYPEVLAVLMDYVYSDEGSLYYYYGPMQGTDPLELEDGWYYNEEGTITNKVIEAGNTDYVDLSTYGQQYIYPTLYSVNAISYNRLAPVMAGRKYELITDNFTDVITGEEVEVVEKVKYTDDNGDGYQRWNRIAAWENNLTTVKLPNVFMTEEDSLRSQDLRIVLEEYVIAESAKFITGQRPLEEIDDFWKELKGMDIEEYIDLYVDAYSVYMDSIFK